MYPAHADGEAEEAIIVIHDEPFSRECVIEALQGAFPDVTIIGVRSVADLYRPTGTRVALVLMKATSHFHSAETVASDVRILVRYFPQAPVVLISIDEDVNVLEAIAAGVQGVVPVTASFKIVVAGLRLVMAGGTYYPPPALIDPPSPCGSMRNGRLGDHRAILEVPTRIHFDSVNERDSPADEYRIAVPPPMPRAISSPVVFTTREAQVLAELQRGRSNKWIAAHLGLSENTIKVHIHHIMRKLSATNRTEAVVRSQQCRPAMLEGRGEPGPGVGLASQPSQRRPIGLVNGANDDKEGVTDD